MAKEIDGLAQLRAVMKAMPPEVRKQAKKQISAEARKIAAAMRAVAPVAPIEGGDLKRSIRTSVSRTGAAIRAGGPRTTTPRGYDYSNAVEFGTEHVTAQPFFWPTWRKQRAAARAAINDVMRDTLIKTWNV